MMFTVISRELLKSLTFRVMSETDKMGFAGVESPVPLIADNDDEGILVIIDGAHAELYAYDGCANFDLVDSCENINELPFKSARDLKIEAEIKKMEQAIAALKNDLCYGE